VSIVLFAVVSWGLALQAGFLQNVSLAAVARLFPYAGVCLTLLVLRRREERGALPARVLAARFRLPAGEAIAVAGVLCAMVIAAQMNARERVSMVVVVAAATLHWVTTRGGARRAAQLPSA
jgi:amino acid transporter